MKKSMFIFSLLIACMSAYAKACDCCGKWSYTRFEYAGHITADCESLSHDFDNTDIEIGENFFIRTYSIDNAPKQVINTDIINMPLDAYENVPVILISKNEHVIQKLYRFGPDTIYVSLDGCRFYFNREY